MAHSPSPRASHTTPARRRFSPSNQETIIKAVAEQLTAKGLTGTSVSAPIGCEASSPRVLLTAPHCSAVSPQKRLAHAINERSADAPRARGHAAAGYR